MVVYTANESEGLFCTKKRKNMKPQYDAPEWQHMRASRYVTDGKGNRFLKILKCYWRWRNLLECKNCKKDMEKNTSKIPHRQY